MRQEFHDGNASTFQDLVEALRVFAVPAGPDLRGKEVAGPSRVPSSLGRRTRAVSLEDVTDGLVAEAVAQIAKGPDDAVVAPGGIVSGRSVPGVLQSRLWWADARAACEIERRRTSWRPAYGAN